MPFNGIGGFTLVAGNPVITGTTISSTVQNNTMTDFANAFANCITRDGQSPAFANIPLGGFKITGLGAGTTNGDAVRWEQAVLLTQLADVTNVGNGDALVGVKRTFVGAIGTTEHDWHEAQVIDAVAEAGMSTAGSAAANTAALNVAIAAAAALGAVGARARVEIAPGNYALTAGTNFASAGVAVVGRGKVVFDYSAGVGIAFKLDAGGSAALIQRLHWENIYIKGGPSITDIFYSRGIVRSLFRNIEIKEGTNRGFALLFPVLNTYDRCVISDDTGVQTTKPAQYWYLDDDGLVGDHAQANTFINCEASGIGVGSVSTGWHLQNAILNAWLGGTGESMQTAVNIANDVCRMNSWTGFDIEDNQQTDVIYRGYGNSFDTMFFQSTAVTHNVDVVSGALASFDSCYIREINLRPASSDTNFKACYFDDNGALGIQNTGSFKRTGCITNTGGVGGNKTGTLRDVLGPSAAATLSGSQNNVPAQTVTLNEVTVTGRMCQQRGKIAFTAAGTAGNSIAVTLDASFPAKATAVGLPVGQFVYTQSGGTRLTGAAVLNSASVLVFTVSSGTNNLGINPAITIANGDTLTFSIDYPLE